MLNNYLNKLVSALERSPLVTYQSVSLNQGGKNLFKIEGLVFFEQGHIFEFTEEVSQNIRKKRIEKKRYRYQFMVGVGKGKRQETIFRYDNAPHHKELESFPDHKHIRSGEVCSVSKIPSAQSVLLEIERYLAERLFRQ